MTNIRGYYDGGTFFDGNPPQLRSGMLLDGRFRNIQEYMWTHFPQRLSLADYMATDVYCGEFPFAVVNSLDALEEALGEPCSIRIKTGRGQSHAEVVNFEGKWLWDIIQWKHDGRWRSSMVASFRTDADLVVAALKLKGREGLSEVPPQALMERHTEAFDNAFNHLYKWRMPGKPTPEAGRF